MKHNIYYKWKDVTKFITAILITDVNTVMSSNYLITQTGLSV
jgi:hypothetical protein